VGIILYFDDEPISEEEVERVINEIANYIHVKGLETAAILFLETSKPLAFIGGGMSRLFIFPFLPVLGEEGDIFSQKMINIFENRRNIERLIQKIEELRDKKDKKKK
jgi:hypothetical protein